jgi:hypothetical protein
VYRAVPAFEVRAVPVFELAISQLSSSHIASYLPLEGLKRGEPHVSQIRYMHMQVGKSMTTHPADNGHA